MNPTASVIDGQDKIKDSDKVYEDAYKYAGYMTVFVSYEELLGRPYLCVQDE